MAADWSIELRGGECDGWSGHTPQAPEAVLIAWTCDSTCDGHMTFDLGDPGIVFSRAVAYRLAELHSDPRRAVYEVGDPEPGDETAEDARELVGTGALA